MDRNQFLIQEGVLTAEPYQQSGLMELERQTPDPSAISLENGYLIDSEKVFCHICGGKRHNRGYSGKTDSGDIILFGSKCAESYFEKDALNAAMRNYQIREATANARFNLQVIKATSGEILNWLNTNEKMIRRVSEAWSEMRDDPNDFVTEVFEHLDKNNNRLTQDYVEEATELSRQEGRHERIVTKKIVLAIGNNSGRNNVYEIWNNYKFIHSFTSKIAELERETNADQIRQIDKKSRSNLFRAIDNLMDAMKFSVQFFAEGTLERIADWSDQERIIRLRGQDKVIHRNLKKTLRKRYGYGYQMPIGNLREIIGNEDFLLKAVEQDASVSKDLTATSP